MAKFLSALLLALALPLSSLAESAAFRLGVAPHTSPRVILEMYQPLRLQLEQALGTRVEVQTAPDFTEFARRALNQEYDLAITTGHQARLYQTAAGYLPLLTYSAEFKAVALVARDSKFRQPADLQGEILLGLSPSSLVTQWGQHWLKSKGLSTENLHYVSAADSVSQQVLAGQASLAFTSLANFQKLPANQQGALRLLAESEPLLGRVYMLNKRWAAQSSTLEQAILRFGVSPAGRQYLAQHKLNGYRKPSARELEAMEPYAAETRRQLNAR